MLEQHKPSVAAEGRRERLRGVRRQIVEHLTKAQQVPAVTFAEECDFTDTDVNLLVPLALHRHGPILPRGHGHRPGVRAG